MKKTPSLMTLVFLLLTASLSRAEEHAYLRTALPPLMEFLDGRRVKTPTQWVERREEIRKLLIKHFIGEFPDTTPRVIDAKIASVDQHADGSRQRRTQARCSPMNTLTISFRRTVSSMKPAMTMLNWRRKALSEFTSIGTSD